MALAFLYLYPVDQSAVVANALFCSMALMLITNRGIALHTRTMCFVRAKLAEWYVVFRHECPVVETPLQWCFVHLFLFLSIAIIPCVSMSLIATTRSVSSVPNSYLLS